MKSYNEILAEKASSLIKEETKKRLGMDNLKIIHYHTNFGISLYINGGSKKIRISDHSVSSFDRIVEEDHFSIDCVEQSIDSIIDSIERSYFPERFEYVEVEEDDTHYSHDIFLSEEEFKIKYYNATIESLRRFINKKGIEKVEIHYSYPKKVTRKVLVRK